MKKTVLLLVIFPLILTISGCGKSVPPNGGATDDTSRLCSSIVSTGVTKQCAVQAGDSTIHITIDSLDDEAGRDVCADVANRMMQLTANFSGKRMLQVFSPYRSDKPLATCPL